MEAELTRGGLCCLVNTPELCFVRAIEWPGKLIPSVFPLCLPKSFSPPTQHRAGGNLRSNWHQPSFRAWHIFREPLFFCQKEVEIEINASILGWKKSPFLHHVPFEKPHSSEAKFIVSLCDSLLCFFFLLLLLKTWYLGAVIEFRF